MRKALYLTLLLLVFALGYLVARQAQSPPAAPAVTPTAPAAAASIEVSAPATEAPTTHAPEDPPEPPAMIDPTPTFPAPEPSPKPTADGGPRVFTSDDLARYREQGTGGGEGTDPATHATATQDWQAQHDADMQRAEEERRARKQERIADLERRLAELGAERDRIFHSVVNSAELSSSQITEQQRIIDEMGEVQEALAEARRD